jgi:hypothetical protein
MRGGIQLGLFAPVDVEPEPDVTAGPAQPAAAADRPEANQPEPQSSSAAAAPTLRSEET